MKDERLSLMAEMVRYLNLKGIRNLTDSGDNQIITDHLN